MFLRKHNIHALLAILILTGIWHARGDLGQISFGEYYRHTRWIDSETHSIIVDAYSNRLVISQPRKPRVVVHGEWRGRAFLRENNLQATIGYFGVAHEGMVASFFGDPQFDKLRFERVLPDPK